jgi:hypothetical protein
MITVHAFNFCSLYRFFNVRSSQIPSNGPEQSASQDDGGQAAQAAENRNPRHLRWNRSCQEHAGPNKQRSDQHSAYNPVCDQFKLLMLVRDP